MSDDCESSTAAIAKADVPLVTLIPSSAIWKERERTPAERVLTRAGKIFVIYEARAPYEADLFSEQDTRGIRTMGALYPRLDLSIFLYLLTKRIH